MRKAFHPNIRFFVGRVDGCFGVNGWVNEHSTIYYKKTKALALALHILSSQGQVYTKVSYGNGFCNDGIYKSEKDLKEALAAFTEEPLLKFIKR